MGDDKEDIKLLLKLMFEDWK